MAKNFFSGLLGKNKAPDNEPAREAESESREILDTESVENRGASDQAPQGTVAAKPEADAPPAKKPGFFSRLRDGLSKTSSQISSGVTTIFTKRKLDDDALEELEDLLIGADLGVATAAKITSLLAREKFDKEVSDQEVRAVMARVIETTLKPLEKPLTIDRQRKPHVILMTGVNGAGKTTTIGKLAQKYRNDGLSVVLAAGDTFRAAAVEQLGAWSERTGAKIVRGAVGTDAASLAFDALKLAKSEHADVLMIDTAGRLQNKRELMDELAKIVRVIRKIDETAPHDTLLVLDATVGQNAISQTETFQAIAGVTGLIMTKLDGTARGGVLVALGEKFNLPIHYIGLGETADALQPFQAKSFSQALTGCAE